MLNGYALIKIQKLYCTFFQNLNKKDILKTLQDKSLHIYLSFGKIKQQFKATQG